MNEFLQTQLHKLSCETAPKVDLLDKLFAKIDFKADKEFIEFISICASAEGFVSPEHYIQFWSIEDMIALNPYYDEIEESRNLFFFGSDGSNLGFAFEKSTGDVVAVDFLEIHTAKPTKLGTSFLDFFHSLEKQ